MQTVLEEQKNSVHPPAFLGSREFCQWHRVDYAYMAGPMAQAIASEELVIAMAQAGFLASFGAAGLSLDRLEAGILKIKEKLGEASFAVNMIHSSTYVESRVVDLFLKHGIKTVEASAFLRLTPDLVRYRALGLSRNAEGQIQIQNKIIAKLSRPELAEHFAHPAPARLLKKLVSLGQISEQAAGLAASVPMADDITVEADSAGHTDGRSLVCMLPVIKKVVRKIERQHAYPHAIRMGAAGGISTPESICAAFALGADYVVTGSINQSCVEAGTSAEVKAMLAKAKVTDVDKAPAADMFEMGIKVQVLKGPTLFAVRARSLYDFYSRYNSWQDIPQVDRQKIEQEMFRSSYEEVWQQTALYFEKMDPPVLEKAQADLKKQMALVFRWYLAKASSWARYGESDRRGDYQIWCGPAMGAFNVWAEGTAFEQPENRSAPQIAKALMQAAALKTTL